MIEWTVAAPSFLATSIPERRRAGAREVNFGWDASKAKGGLPHFQAWAPV